MAENLPEIAAHDADRERWQSAEQEALHQTAPLRQLLTREWIHPYSGGVVELVRP